MSLNVTEEQVERASNGELSEAEFVEIIRDSLPFAYDTVERLAKQLANGDDVVIEAPLHMEDGDRAQLLRAFASTSMRTALECHFGIAELAFQNCHSAGGTTDEGKKSQRWKRFTSIEGQVLNQHPALRDC